MMNEPNGEVCVACGKSIGEPVPEFGVALGAPGKEVAWIHKACFSREAIKEWAKGIP